MFSGWCLTGLCLYIYYTKKCRADLVQGGLRVGVEWMDDGVFFVYKLNLLRDNFGPVAGWQYLL